jgi:hypothetical protein
VIPEARELLVALPVGLQRTFGDCYDLLVDEGTCEAYVKTIYTGFALNGAMVCAIYPHSDHLEIAMALSEDVEGAEFKDATHLTWPTMPVAVEVYSGEDTHLVLSHLREALRRVSAKEHDVLRPNEYFRGRKESRA